MAAEGHGSHSADIFIGGAWSAALASCRVSLLILNVKEGDDIQLVLTQEAPLCRDYPWFSIPRGRVQTP